MNSYSVLIIKTFYNRFKNFSYFIVDNETKDAAIIDPAWEIDKVKMVIDKYNVNLRKILLTHHHYDHVNLVAPLIKNYKTFVYMHKIEIENYNFKVEKLIPIKNEDIIRIGKTNIKCLHTPGHTKGSVCYCLENALFTGDTVFIEGCGVCDLKGGCVSDMYYSIEKIKKMKNNMLIYPGHSYGKEPGCDLAYLKMNNIYFQLCKDKFETFRMRRNQTGYLSFK